MWVCSRRADDDRTKDVGVRVNGSANDEESRGRDRLDATGVAGGAGTVVSTGGSTNRGTGGRAEDDDDANGMSNSARTCGCAKDDAAASSRSEDEDGAEGCSNSADVVG